MEQLRCNFCHEPTDREHAYISDLNPRRLGVICHHCLDALMITHERRPAGPGAAAMGAPAVVPRKLAQHTGAALPEPIHPQRLLEVLNQKVAGQHHAKEALAVAVATHLQRLHNPDLKVNPHLFLVGPTGVGKTHMIKVAAQYLGLPYVIAGATSLTAAGYVGDDVETLLARLFARAEGNIKKAEMGIVFLDEADKLARKSGRQRAEGRDVGGEAVQQALLKLVEGTEAPIPHNLSGPSGSREYSGVTMNTSRLLWVFAGAFEGIEELVKERLGVYERSIGFGASAQAPEPRALYPQITHDDLVEYGIIPELIGRIGNLGILEPLTRDDLLHILNGTGEPLIKSYLELARSFQVEVELPRTTLEFLAEQALELGTGARALHTLLSKAFRPILARQKPGSKVVVTPQMLRGLL